MEILSRQFLVTGVLQFPSNFSWPDQGVLRFFYLWIGLNAHQGKSVEHLEPWIVNKAKLLLTKAKGAAKPWTSLLTESDPDAACASCMCGTGGDLGLSSTKEIIWLMKYGNNSAFLVCFWASWLMSYKYQGWWQQRRCLWAVGAGLGAEAALRVSRKQLSEGQ